MKAVTLLLLLLIPALLVYAAVRNLRHEQETQARIAALTAQPSSATTRLSLEQELLGLPAPVQRYFRAALTDGMALPVQARIRHAGDFLLSPPEGWKPFTSVEYFVASPPGFVWDARITMLPGLAVKVRDALVDGNGYMTASLLGALPLVDVRNTPAIAQGALTRYLAEGPWFPVLLLPSRGVRWSVLDAHSARATLTVGETTAAVDFFFDAQGLVERVYCADRMRDVDGVGVPTPWQGRMQQYERHAAMLVPMVGEVGWLLPEGEQVYWRGRVTAAEYL